MTDTAPRIATRSRENTRQRLLDAAARVFAEVGLDGASVEAICERAGFTRGAFYSNFDSKDELFIELVGRVAEQKLQSVSDRVRELEASGLPRLSPGEIVQRVLDVSIDERLGVLLMSEIRTHAMRDARLAQAYLDWQNAMGERVERIILDLVRAYHLRLRLPAGDLARLFMMSWEDTAARAVIEGLDYEATCALVSERTGQLAVALVEDPAA